MDNELKEIAGALAGYSEHPGWQITKAERQQDGSWMLMIQPETPKKQEAEHEDN